MTEREEEPELLNEERDEYDVAQTKDIRRIVVKELSKCNQQLSDALYNSLPTFSSLMLQNEFISNHVHEKNQKFEVIIHDFKAGLSLLNLDELRNHCIKFLSVLTEVGGPVIKAAELLRKNWNKKVNEKYKVNFLQVPLQERSQSEPYINPNLPQKTKRSQSEGQVPRYSTPEPSHVSPTNSVTLPSLLEETIPEPLSTHEEKSRRPSRIAYNLDLTGTSDHQHLVYQTKDFPETNKNFEARSEDMPVPQTQSFPPGPVVFPNTDLRDRHLPHTDPPPQVHQSLQESSPGFSKPSDLWSSSHYQQNMISPILEKILTEMRTLCQKDKDESYKAYTSKLERDNTELKSSDQRKRDKMILERERKVTDRETELDQQLKLLKEQVTRSDERDKQLMEREKSCVEELKRLSSDQKSYQEETCKEREQRLANIEAQLQGQIDQLGKELETKVDSLKEQEMKIKEQVQKLEDQEMKMMEKMQSSLREERQQLKKRFEDQKKVLIRNVEQHNKEIDEKHEEWKEELTKCFGTQKLEQLLAEQQEMLMKLHQKVKCECYVIITLLIILIIFIIVLLFIVLWSLVY